MTSAARPIMAASRARRRSRRHASGDNTNATAPIGNAPARTSPNTNAMSWPPGFAGGASVVETRQAAGLGVAGAAALGLGGGGGGGGGGATDGVGSGAVEAGGGGGAAVDAGEGDGVGEGGGGGGEVTVYGVLAAPLGAGAPVASNTSRRIL